ncbi:hypothetical protein [Thalassotalea euphylliae]|uniref:Uncharacterized protein n=1 Tax=Thalassotalea euphylliae TaxID=1655234 RepID=A0A3E0UKH0_9GAMM|nr:hypothetical protein [Thalassotalea euphylliae]REL31413.1 hypothetical protein DXX94_12190 [Thalassotalea euphylliae]REL37123.1 hypothetical protein DXX92_18390 [Thalassotalea euphylliae]
MKTLKTLTVITIAAVTFTLASNTEFTSNKASTLAKVDNKPSELEKFGRCLDFPLCRERVQ